jgi:hypothetical protein
VKKVNETYEEINRSGFSGQDDLKLRRRITEKKRKWDVGVAHSL